MSKQGQQWTWDAVLTGIVPPVISPLSDAGAVDGLALDGLSNHILAEGATGLFILGGARGRMVDVRPTSRCCQALREGVRRQGTRSRGGYASCNRAYVGRGATRH